MVEPEEYIKKHDDGKGYDIEMQKAPIGKEVKCPDKNVTCRKISHDEIEITCKKGKIISA